METPPPTNDPQDARPRGPGPLLLFGGLAALLAGGAIAWVLVSSGKNSTTAPPASEAGLVIEAGDDNQGRIDPGKPLRCFVQGQFVGELSLTQCAQRNGVATDALDVGIDESGALAAAEQAGQAFVPLPPEEAGPAPDEAQPADPVADTAPAPIAGVCWRHGGGRWRKLAGDPDLNGCVQALFAGRCEKPGGASYGRFGAQTLRLVTGKVEISDDNKTFRFLGIQGTDCAIPPV